MFPIFNYQYPVDPNILQHFPQWILQCPSSCLGRMLSVIDKAGTAPFDTVASRFWPSFLLSSAVLRGSRCESSFPCVYTCRLGWANTRVCVCDSASVWVHVAPNYRASFQQASPPGIGRVLLCPKTSTFAPWFCSL